MGRFVIQPHVRLQEWVADELGFFRDEGLDYEFQTGGFSSASLTSATVQPADAGPAVIQHGAFEDMSAGRTCDVSYHSGSHYSAIQGLEKFLTREQINLRFAGTPHDRARHLLSGRVAAANLFGAHFYIAEQLGFRKIVDTTFMMGFLVNEDADLEDTERYFRALRRAQREIDVEPEAYKHYYARELPADLLEQVDVRRFGPGERIVFEPYTRELFERTQRWMQLWDLFTPEQAAQSRFEEAVLV
jgi:NitT/TauT family transport system substrate-binding protein